MNISRSPNLDILCLEQGGRGWDIARGYCISYPSCRHTNIIKRSRLILLVHVDGCIKLLTGQVCCRQSRVADFYARVYYTVANLNPSILVRSAESEGQLEGKQDG